MRKTEFKNMVASGYEAMAICKALEPLGENGLTFKSILRPTMHGDYDHSIIAMRFFSNMLQVRIDEKLWIRVSLRPNGHNYVDPDILCEFIAAHDIFE